MPIHPSVHPGGKHLLLANWGDGSVVVRQLEADGALGSVTDVVPREQAAAHMIVTDRRNVGVLVGPTCVLRRRLRNEVERLPKA